MHPQIDENGSSREKSRGSARIILTISVLSVVATFIATPRPTRPHVLPLPHFDLKELSSTQSREISRVASVRDGSLPHDVRAVGEQVRRIGSKIYQRMPVAAKELRRLSMDAASLIEAGKSEPLRDLRALQGQLFIEAVRESLARESPSSDVQELGGEFWSVVTEAWFDETGSCTIDEATLRLMFRVHFNQLTGLGDHPDFAISLNEIRAYYATLLEHPKVPRRSSGAMAARQQIAYVNGLAAADPAFEPRALLGILNLRMGRYGHAIKELEAFIDDHPNGPFSHAARGHLAYARLEAQRSIAGTD